MIKYKYWNNRKYLINQNRWIRIGKHEYSLSWDTWNYYNPNNLIIKGDGYIIHHIDENTLNDKIGNLQKMKRGEHATLHLTNRIVSEKTKENLSKAGMNRYKSKEERLKTGKLSIGNKSKKGNFKNRLIEYGEGTTAYNKTIDNFLYREFIFLSKFKKVFISSFLGKIGEIK